MLCFLSPLFLSFIYSIIYSNIYSALSEEETSCGFEALG